MVVFSSHEDMSIERKEIVKDPRELLEADAFPTKSTLQSIVVG
jgi:hypothetical protein